MGDHSLRIAAKISFLDLGKVNEGISETPVTRVAGFMPPPLPAVESGTQFQAVEGPVALETHDHARPFGHRVCPVDEGGKSRSTVFELMLINSTELAYCTTLGNVNIV